MAHRGVVHGLLLVVGLIAALIVGLLAMHTLNLHGAAAAHVPTSASSVEATGAVHDHDSAAHPAAQSASAGHVAAAAICGECATGGSGLAVACALILLFAGMLLLAPRTRGSWWRPAPIAPPSRNPRSPVRSRAPSLEMLCISRT